MAHLGLSGEAFRVHLPSEDQPLRHTKPGLGERFPAAREGGLQLLGTPSDILVSF